MSDKIKIYQKPTCSKCRTTIGILRDRGADFESINYYEKPLGVEELRKLIDKLGIAPRSSYARANRSIAISTLQSASFPMMN